MRARAGYSSIIGATNIPTSSAAPGSWSANASARQIGGSSAGLYWPGPKDPDFATVVKLCHCDRMNGQGALYDSSPAAADGVLSGAVGEASGLATSPTPKFGQYCLRIGSSGSNGPGVFFTGVPSDTNFQFGTADFTMEGFFYQTTGGTLQILLDTRLNGSNTVAPTIYINASNKLNFYQDNADRITGTTSVTQNTWHHFAASRVSGSTYLYLDGAQEGSTYADTNNYVGQALYIGTGGLPSSPLRGFMDEIRVNKGHGYYSGATLTVPTQPFPDY